MAVAMIVRQTGYDEKTARSRLADHGGDAIATIREYTRGGTETQPAGPSHANSVNQRIYGEIRSLMDAAGAEHRKMQAEKEKQERSLAVFKSQARLLANITSVPPHLRGASGQPSASFSDAGKAFTDPPPLTFTVVDCDSRPGCLAPNVPWLARTVELSSCADTIARVRRAGGAGCVLGPSENKDGTAWMTEARALWPDAALGVTAFPHGPPWSIAPLGDRPPSNLEAGRVLRSRKDDGELQVCPDREYTKAVNSLLAQEKAGADFALTEPFYDVGTFLRFVRETQKAGSTLKIIPTIRIIGSVEDFNTSASERYIRVPPGVEATVARLSGDTEASKLAEYGTALAVTACKALLLRGVQHIHLEADDPRQVKAVLSKLGMGCTDASNELERPSGSSG